MSANDTESGMTELESRIRAAIQTDSHSDTPRISVAVHGDCAVLSGGVRSWADHEHAEAAALMAPGIRKVDNRLALLIKGKPCDR